MCSDTRSWSLLEVALAIPDAEAFAPIGVRHWRFPRWPKVEAKKGVAVDVAAADGTVRRGVHGFCSDLTSVPSKHLC